jgi:hypothetical protein
MSGHTARDAARREARQAREASREARRDQHVDLYRQSPILADISARTGHSTSTVERDLDARGVTLRARGGSAPAADRVARHAEHVSPTEAIAILAGRPLAQRGATAALYQRHYLRLKRAAKRGALTRHPAGAAGGSSRYLRAEVEQLRDRYAQEGIGTGVATTSARRRLAMLRAAAPDGYVDSVQAAQIAGVDPTTPAHWAQKGWYGAVRIGGRWFFDRQQVARKRKQFESRVQVACADCGASLLVSQERLRRTRIFYCGECWPEQNRKRGAKEAQAALAAMDPDEKHELLSDARKGMWAAAGPEARAEKGRQLAQGADAVRKSTKRSVAHANAVSLGRGGDGLSEERKREIAGRALRRAQRASERSENTRKLEAAVRELWPTAATQMEIANAVHLTPQRVGQIARELELPPRPRGRPLRNVKETPGGGM